MFNSANIDAAVEGAITAKFRHTAQVFTDPLSFSPNINQVMPRNFEALIYNLHVKKNAMAIFGAKFLNAVKNPQYFVRI